MASATTPLPPFFVFSKLPVHSQMEGERAYHSLAVVWRIDPYPASLFTLYMKYWMCHSPRLPAGAPRSQKSGFVD